MLPSALQTAKALLARLSFPFMAHRDLASRIHVRNAAESGQIRTDANDPELTYAGSNPTLHRAPDLILADAVCCRGVPGWQQMALSLSRLRSVRIASHLASPTTHLRCGSR